MPPTERLVKLADMLVRKKHLIEINNITRYPRKYSGLCKTYDDLV